jgi:hypothetical protein
MGGTMKRKWTPRRIFLWGLGGYLIANLAYFVFDPFSSPWHYYSHKPRLIEVVQAGDGRLSLAQISATLDEIDLAYRGREPTKSEKTPGSLEQAAAAILFPGSMALNFKYFMGYMGPATREQQAFTLSVKKRYNHLARLAIAKGMTRDGHFFIEDIRLRKRKGAAFKGRKLATGAKSCGLEKTTRSTSGKEKTRLRFVNRSDEVIKVFWLTYMGKRKFYKLLGPGKAYTQRTTVSHAWVVTNAGDVCVGLYFPGLETKKIIIK